MNRTIFIILFALFSGLHTPVLAQETEEDPYSDYSYLWDDDAEKKTDKKKKKQKKADEPAEQTVIEEEEIVPEPTADSLQLPEEAPLDSLEQPSEDVIMPSDTVEVTQDTTQQEESWEAPWEEESVEPQETPKKERAEAPPMQDFRSGMGNSSSNAFNGGFTFTQIGDQYYAGMVLSPEFSIGKVGVGLNVPILYGLEDQSIRTEIFEDGVGAARLITYVRYGVQKADPVYVKVGQLDNTMIGFGGLINNYTNTTSFEKRKLGFHYDFNVKGLVGLEGMYSDFNPGSFNLFAVRPYVRPLIYTGIPIIKTFEVGATLVRDSDQTAIQTSDSTATSYRFTRNGIGAFGLDAGFTLLRVPFIQIDLFANYSKLNVSSDALEDSLATSSAETMTDGFQDGSGASVGLNFRFHFIADVLSTDIRIERLSYTEHYLPQFFDATYEINKDAKLFSLGSAGKMSGFYGSLTGHILKKVRLGGSLMLPDDISDEAPAFVSVHADLDRLADKFSFHGTYIKGNLTNLEEAFVFDERSLAKLRVIYHLNKFLATGLDYYWAFTPTADGGYRAEQYVSPYFGVSIQF